MAAAAWSAHAPHGTAAAGCSADWRAPHRPRNNACILHVWPTVCPRKQSHNGRDLWGCVRKITSIFRWQGEGTQSHWGRQRWRRLVGGKGGWEVQQAKPEGTRNEAGNCLIGTVRDKRQPAAGGGSLYAASAASRAHPHAALLRPPPLQKPTAAPE